MADVVFVLGLSRVGSTLLDIILGTKSPYIGVGELYEVFRPEWAHYKRDLVCSCGMKADCCPFWEGLCAELARFPDSSPEQKYSFAINHFRNVFGETAIMVDSSKLLEALKAILDEHTAKNVKVIHLVRDVRPWTISRLDDRSRNSRHFRKEGYYIKNLIYRYGWKIRVIWPLLVLLTRFSSYYYWLWHLQNLTAERYLESNNINYQRVSYEALTLRTETTLAEIGSFLGTPSWNSEIPELGSSQSHILLGNPRRDHPERMNNITYDDRWFFDNRWLIPSILFPNIGRHNKRLIYK